MVGARGIEPLTPSMSRKCSTAELSALRATAQHVRGDVLYRQTFGVASEHRRAYGGLGPASDGQQPVDLAHEVLQMEGLGEDARVLGRTRVGVQSHGREAGDEH